MHIFVKHPNGYKGRLYGESSLIVFDKDDNEVLHTGFRNCETKEELYELLEGMPEFFKGLEGVEIDEDDADDI